MKKKKGFLLKDFKQELLYTILIPFYIEDQFGKPINKNIDESDIVVGLFTKDSLLHKNSQFYDYIEDFYLDNSVSFFEGTKDVILDLEKKLFSLNKYKIKRVFIQSAINSIVIIGVTIKFKKIFTMEDIHRQKIEISDTIKQSKIKEYINSYLNTNDDYKLFYFDSYDGISSKNGKKLQTIRFTSFVSLIKDHSDKLLDKNIKLNISNYFLDRMSVSSPVNNKNFPKEEIFYGSEIFVSSEGILLIYEKTIENKDISNVFIDSNFARDCLLLSYLINLQEFYKLHYIKIKINKIFCQEKELQSDEIKFQLDSLESEFVYFLSKYHATSISSFEWLKNIYSKIYTSLDIDKYIVEVKNSLTIYKNYIEKKNNDKEREKQKERDLHNKKLEKQIKIFACITLCNTVISIFFNFIKSHFSDSEELTKVNLLMIIFYWIGIVVSLISFVIMLKNIKKSNKI